MNILRLLSFSIIVFLFTGCVTRNPKVESIYDLPQTPFKRDVSTSVIKKGEVATEDGLFLSAKDASNFLKNDIEKENYIKKLVILLKTIEKSDIIDFNGKWYE